MLTIMTSETTAMIGPMGFIVEADVARFHEDKRGMPCGVDSVKLLLRPAEARAYAAALMAAADAAEGRLFHAVQPSLPLVVDGHAEMVGG